MKIKAEVERVCRFGEISRKRSNELENPASFFKSEIVNTTGEV